MATNVKAAAKVVLTPFNKVGNAIHSRAVLASRFSSSELKERIAQADATGDDLATDSTKAFVQLQYDLISYRIQKFKVELNHFLNEPLGNYTYKNWFVFFRFLVRCLFIYMGALMVGRRSIYPPVYPDSPFVKELAIKYSTVSK
eukprot:PhF_6_TR9309/c0_g1_i1/m.14717